MSVLSRRPLCLAEEGRGIEKLNLKVMTPLDSRVWPPEIEKSPG